MKKRMELIGRKKTKINKKMHLKMFNRTIYKTFKLVADIN